MDIQIFHRYNRMVALGLAQPLKCNHCSEKLTLRATEDGDPVLQCFMCETIVQPGLNLYNGVKAQVGEFYV